MIWVVDHGLLHDASIRWRASQITFTYRWFDTDLSSFSSVDALTSYYIKAEKKKNPTGKAPELSDGSFESAIIRNAWSFAHEIKIGDYVVLGCMGTMHVGRIAGVYDFALDSRGKAVHSYQITQVENFVNAYEYPREIRHLFRDTAFGQINDSAIEHMLERAVAGDVLSKASVAHLMFEEMSQANPDRTGVGKLALEYILNIITAPEHCDTCERVCTEIVHIDDNEVAINHPDGVFVPWSALYDLKDRIQWELNNEGLDRHVDESDLAMVRRYLDEREDRGSGLASWNLEGGYPLLFGLRQDHQERWAWVMVNVDRSGYDASLTDDVFTSRELAIPYFHKFGFRKASDVSAMQLIKLGFEDPEGQHLESESND